MQQRLRPVIAGLVAGALGLALSELLAGAVAGAPSLVTAVGSLVIDLQPPGAKQLVVDLFGTADKLALNLVVLVVALAISALLGFLGRNDHRIAVGGAAAIALAAAL